MEAHADSSGVEVRLRSVVATTLLVASLAYVPQVRFSLAVFFCRGGALESDPFVLCGTVLHQGIRVLAAFVLAVVGVGLPAVFYLLVRASVVVADDLHHVDSLASLVGKILAEP